VPADLDQTGLGGGLRSRSAFVTTVFSNCMSCFSMSVLYYSVSYLPALWWNKVCICNRPGSLDPGAQPSVIATLDLSTVDYYNRLLLFNVLNTALNRGYLDTMRVSPNGFSFRPITGACRVSCSWHRYSAAAICLRFFLNSGSSNVIRNKKS